MKEKQLITGGKTPESISESTVYLTLLAEEIDSHGKSHYQGEYTNFPMKLALRYLEYKGSYWEVMEACLRNFGDIKHSEFTDDYKEVALEIYKEDLKSAVNDLLNYVSDKVRNKSKKIQFNINENAHSHPFVFELLKKKVPKDSGDIKQDESNYIKRNSTAISLLKIQKSTVAKFERMLINVAQKGLMEQALQFAERRAKLNGGNFKFKKLMHSLAEIYEDFIFNSTTNKPKKSIIEKEDSELINLVTNKYEVIGNNTYLLNRRKYKKAVREHFVPKLKEMRIKNAKS